jgi:hypothetical protein
MSINGYSPSPYMINGLNDIDANNIVCETIETSFVSYEEIKQLQGINVNTTIQAQINTLINNGGCFCILATQNAGFIANSYWGFSSGSNPTTNIPLVFSYGFRIIGITITCQTNPSSSATVQIRRNGSLHQEFTGINSTLNTFDNLTLDYVAGDSFNIFTVSGSGGGLVRMSVSCQVGGVKGEKGDTGDNGTTPTFTIGTVSNLASGSTPTVNLTGTSTNPILNFGLVQGIQGIQGAKGDTGAQGEKGDKGDTGSISAITQAQIDANTAGLVSLGLTVTALEADVATLDASVAGLTTDITTINEEIDALQGKTQYITTNVSTITTNFASKITATNDISTAGKLTASSDITTTANISGNQISTTTGNIDAITTSSTQTQNIYGSTVNIGTTGINNVNIGSATSSIYINGIPYLPFSNSTSYFNQWP